jgi:pilus assembly protein CpaC
MNSGQTLALAGLIQTQIESEMRGLPVLSDLPWLGAAFRRVREQANEIELLVLVTPEFIDALDPQDVPPCGPGELTTSPSDAELYGRGYLEVPNQCNAECRIGLYEGEAGIMTGPPIPTHEILPAAPQVMRRNDAAAYGGSLASPIRPVVKANGNSTPAVGPRPGLIGPVGYDIRD